MTAALEPGVDEWVGWEVGHAATKEWLGYILIPMVPGVQILIASWSSDSPAECGVRWEIHWWFFPRLRSRHCWARVCCHPRDPESSSTAV